MISTIKVWFRRLFGVKAQPVRRAPKKVAPVSATKRRLKAQERRREALRRHNEAMDRRYLGRGVKGLNALFGDAIGIKTGRKVIKPKGVTS